MGTMSPPSTPPCPHPPTGYTRAPTCVLGGMIREIMLVPALHDCTEGVVHDTRGGCGSRGVVWGYLGEG